MNLKKIKKFEIINTIFICLSCILIFVGSILLSNEIIYIDKFSYILYFILIVSIILLIINKINLKKYILVLLLAIFGLISTLLSSDIVTCLLGAQFRNEGYIVILSYLALFLLSSLIKNDKCKEIIINIILILGIVNVIYGLLQFLKIIDINTLYPRSFLGNANSFGAICTLYVGLSFGLFIFSKRKLYIIYLIISTIGLIISGCMGCYLGFAAIIISIIIYIVYLLCKRQKVKSYMIKIIILFLCVLPIYLFSTYNRQRINKDVKTVINQVVNVMQGNINDDFGNHRIEIWSKTLSVAPNYLIHGIGIDRFYYALDNGSFQTSEGLYVDKAHNEYLQILITEGIFALITYLIFLGWVIKNAFKNTKYNYVYIALLFAIVGYLVQAFFGISVTRVTPYLYIIMGLAINCDKNKKNIVSKTDV